VLNVLRDKRFAWIPSVAAAALVLLVGSVLAPSTGERVEDFVYDLAMRTNDAAPSSTIAIIAIDKESTNRLGAWPWPRSVHAQLVNKLHDAGVRSIAFAFPMSEAQSNAGLDRVRAALNLLKSSDAADSARNEQLKKLLDSSVADLDEDGALADAIARHGNVLLPIEGTIANSSSVEQVSAAAQAEGDHAHAIANAEALRAAPLLTELRLPASRLATAARGLGHLVLQADEDQVVRTDIAAVRDGDKLVPSLALAIGASQQGVDVSKIRFVDDSTVEFGERRLQLSDGLRWRGAVFPATGTRAIARYSYWQVLAGDINAEDLRGKSVVVGLTAESATLTLNTPQKEARAAAGIVASFAASLTTEHTFTRPMWGVVVQWLLSAGILALAVWLLPQLGVLIGTILAVLLGSALLFVEVTFLNMTGTWMQLALPATALLAAAIGTSAARAAFRLAGPRARANDPIGSLRTLGLTFQGQGQLDLAYETFRRCPADNESLELIYGLGLDYERRRQFGKAAEVYGYIASVDANFKDVQPRRERMKRSELAMNAANRPVTKTDGQARSPSVTPLRPVPQAQKSTGKQSLGRYEIERELGKGAMGVVYLGRDPKINRVVAIKAIALAEEFAEDDLADARARFFREAEMAGRLNHPGIVTVYDAGEDRGLAYIAMEYLRGEHLSHYAEAIHLLPIAKVLALMARVADALDYAHKQNVVHRDIKPANIMFNADTDELKITDFGIARLTDTSRTKTGIVLGTPSFMSPEQLEGRPLDGRSDLFALGVAMYQLLTGQLPFRADSMTRLMHKIAIEAHVPLLALRPELPELAEQIMTRALAKSAQDRYQTGAEMAVALRGCIRLVMRKDALAR
jgi:serine/threonine-protein kinase